MTVLWKANPGSEEKVAELLRNMVDPTRAEPGCVTYEVARSVDDPTAFLLYEVYRDKEALDAHAASQHFKRLVVEQAMPMLESRIRTFYHPL